MKSLEVFFSQAEKYLNQAIDELFYNTIDNGYIIDHICYKCKSESEFLSIRKLFEAHSDVHFLYQVRLSGRRVVYIKLYTGIKVRDHTIFYVELAENKNVTENTYGFHHIEIFPENILYEDLVVKFDELKYKICLKKRPHHTTYDVFLNSGILMRLTEVPLIKKIFLKDILME